LGTRPEPLRSEADEIRVLAAFDGRATRAELDADGDAPAEDRVRARASGTHGDER
jgi:hypothetical protein